MLAAQDPPSFPPPQSRTFGRGDNFGEGMPPPHPAVSPSPGQAALLPPTPACPQPGTNSDPRGGGGGNPHNQPPSQASPPPPAFAEEEGEAEFWGTAPRAPLSPPARPPRAPGRRCRQAPGSAPPAARSSATKSMSRTTRPPPAFFPPRRRRGEWRARRSAQTTNSPHPLQKKTLPASPPHPTPQLATRQSPLLTHEATEATKSQDGAGRPRRGAGTNF